MTMKRRKFLLGTSSAAIGGSALLGSGAFSRVESQRDVSIAIAHDSDAYLGLDRCGGEDPAPNSSYIEFDDKGHLGVQMNPDNPTDAGGLGVNSNSRSWFDNVFQITNQGKTSVCVWIDNDPSWPWYNGERRVDFYNSDNRDESVIGLSNAFELDVGESKCIGISVVTKALEDGEGYQLLEELGNEITIIADEDCPTPDPVTESGRLSLAYEDLPVDDPIMDWDYNDWVVDIFGSHTRCDPNGSGIDQLAFDIVPQTRQAGDTHTWEFEFDCGGNYELTYYDADGAVIGSDIASFDPGPVRITIWEDTGEIMEFDENECILPAEWAQLEIFFDECCAFDTLGGDFATHGDDLPFNPILTNNDTPGVEVGRGDERLLVVEDEWSWPQETVPIYEAYEDVQAGPTQSDPPTFPDGWEDSAIDNQVVPCDVRIDEDDNSLFIDGE